MEYSTELHILLEQVCDEETFLIFLKALMNDRIDEIEKEKISPSSPYEAGANGWQNNTIDGFLEAAIAWAEDSKDGLKYYEKESNPWKRCADILYMGKVYE